MTANFTAHISRWNYLHMEMGPSIVSRLKGQRIMKKTNNFILLPPVCYSCYELVKDSVESACMHQPALY
jgi:hypothetical protein